MTDSSPTPELEEKKQLARRIPEDVLTEGDLDLLDELYTEDAVEHTPSGDVEGRTGLQNAYEGFRAAFPDVSLTVEDIVAEGDSVAMRLVVQGAHEGQFMGGIEPTGQEFEVQKWALTRIKNGMIIERWVLPDMFGMLTQLGIIEPSTG
ncbi:ester cyclase [Halocatena marina]|uniref:Ester cyclase n=1 Tax=Halocatena marina TaxID=2934937 RepID=A0ABD5YYF2_9EURY|nr:ester cyclase [Halocatena marina]